MNSTVKIARKHELKMNKKMDFAEYAIQDVVDLSHALIQLIKIYSEENLKAFDEEKQIRIIAAAVTKLFSDIYITNINYGISDIKRFIKAQNLMLEYIKKRTKNE